MISWFEALLRWLSVEPERVRRFVVLSPDHIAARDLIREVRPAWFGVAVLIPAHELADHPEYAVLAHHYVVRAQGKQKFEDWFRKEADAQGS